MGRKIRFSPPGTGRQFPEAIPPGRQTIVPSDRSAAITDSVLRAIGRRPQCPGRSFPSINQSGRAARPNNFPLVPAAFFANTNPIAGILLFPELIKQALTAHGSPFSLSLCLSAITAPPPPPPTHTHARAAPVVQAR